MENLIIIEDKIEKKYLTMTAIIDFKTKDGEYTPTNNLENCYVDIGGFSFECMNLENKPACLSFDFDANEIGNDENNEYISYESGRGLLFNAYEISEVYDDALKKAGFDIYDITPKLLSETTKIKEFHFDIDPRDENETSSIEEFKLIDVYFNGDDNKDHHISKDVLDEFNQNWEDRI